MKYFHKNIEAARPKWGKAASKKNLIISFLTLWLP